MRKLLFLVTIGLISSITLNAKKIDGKILFENDTVDVIFKIPFNFFTQELNYEKLQNKVKYYDSDGNKVILRPDQAKEIRFNDGFFEIRMLSRYNSLGLGSMFSMSTNIFLKLETDGYLKLFRYYYTQNSVGMYNGTTGTMTGGYSYSVENYILQKGNLELKRPKGLMFRKDMIEYFSDCPELSKKIEGKEFRKNDLESIVRYYYIHCEKE